MATEGQPRESYERAQVGGRFYLVCAGCRMPLVTGHSPVHAIPQPGRPSPDPTRQAVCGPCYVEGWKRVYPETPPPDIADGRLAGAEPIPWDAPQPCDELESEMQILERAIEAARSSGGAETILEAFTRLSNPNPPTADVSYTPMPGE